MSEAGRPRPDPSVIGVIPKPPFVRLPDPGEPVRRAAPRASARWPAATSSRPTCGFLADLVGRAGGGAGRAARAGAAGGRGCSTARRATACRRSTAAGFVAGPAFGALLDRLLDRARGIDMPRGRPRRARPGRRRPTRPSASAMVADVLADAIPFEAIAEHALVAAALQVHFARLAAGARRRPR